MDRQDRENGIKDWGREQAYFDNEDEDWCRTHPPDFGDDPKDFLACWDVREGDVREGEDG